MSIKLKLQYDMSVIKRKLKHIIVDVNGISEILKDPGFADARMKLIEAVGAFDRIESYIYKE